ncbi:zinc-binding alcohol dehydrogenase family protein [Diaminobutyricimonas aerilata]|uniref:Zinc-type alcohol dehydrogenase-like protein n=1 Tax=Diaminobutyricimonas aerilata TaxID=1162967 RepID=A0A2M9CNY6_9MICO|nr:zinc-binding alcohol dehydrogenase family protein [Diaminobutyricimonas aerilata]PJJ73592.1 zinc-binding alcohol dehydrogenase family protein [Diaminobutyricimonas aerilata]
MPTTTAYLARSGRDLDASDVFVAEEVPVPALRSHDVLVRVHAVSVNPVDTKSRAGLRTGTRQLGWDASGVVEAVGDRVERFAPGDEVWYAGDLGRPGTNAELHAVDERIVGRKPASLTHAEAAALPLTAITAWETLFDRFRLTAESTGTLVVVGAPGGVGSILVQLAKKLTGLTVIATAGRPESREWVQALGADHVVDHRDLVAQVTAIAPRGVDYLFTAHSAGNVPAFAEIVRPFGHITAIDDPRGLDLMPLKRKSIAWHWELMFTRPMFETPDMGEQGRLLDEVSRLVDAGELRTTATTVIPRLDAEGLREAHRLVASGTTIGKVVLVRH